MLEALVEQLEHLHWDTATLARHRRIALSEALSMAATHSPWHAERLAGIDLAAVTPDDLSSLPTMTKTDLMAGWDRVVTDPRLTLAGAREHLERVDDDGPVFLLGAYVVFNTGGSTGEPGVFPWSVEEFCRWAASNFRLGADAGLGPPERLTFVGARSRRHPSAIPPLMLYGREVGAQRVVAVDQPLDDIVAALNDVMPDSIWTVSSILPALVDAKRRGALRIAPRVIAIGGDTVDARAVDDAETTFGVRPTETYPTTDVGHIAAQAPGEEGMVVNDDLLIVEAVDDGDRPVPPGTASHHLLITSLHQRTLPLIRYRIDDRVTFDPRPSPRYPAYSRIAVVDGRADDLFRYGDVTVHPHAFRTVLSRHPGVREYQVRQTDAGAVVSVVVEGTLASTELGEELRSGLRAAGLRDPDVAVEVVDAIERSDVGKRLIFVSRRADGTAEPR
jgi:phenylacetate-coenzyme A ligase PaaK-like adenylate-forming protein